MTEDELVERVAVAVRLHGDLTVDVDVGVDVDLYEAGLSSLSAVRVLLALEDDFGIEFPDHLLNRDLFSSIRRLAAEIRSVVQRPTT